MYIFKVCKEYIESTASNGQRVDRDREEEKHCKSAVGINACKVTNKAARAANSKCFNKIYDH